MLFNDLESMEMRHTSLIMSKQQSCQDLFTLFGMSRLTFPKPPWTSQRKLSYQGPYWPRKFLIITSIARYQASTCAKEAPWQLKEMILLSTFIQSIFCPKQGCIHGGARAIILKKSHFIKCLVGRILVS